jgi:hypothetical protein
VLPWLLHADALREVQVFFCANLHVFGDQEKTDEALQELAEGYLFRHPVFSKKPVRVRAKVQSTAQVICQLIESVCKAVNQGRGKRFGNLLKDAVRELHRYHRPELEYRVYDETGNPLGSKEEFAAKVRKATVLHLLKAFECNCPVNERLATSVSLGVFLDRRTPPCDNVIPSVFGPGARGSTPGSGLGYRSTPFAASGN